MKKMKYTSFTKLMANGLNSKILDIILSLHFVVLCINTRVPIFKDHYNILDVNRMNKKQLYTCLSRTTKYEYIHLDKFLNSIYMKYVNNLH